jgi:hypothetical protein
MTGPLLLPTWEHLASRPQIVDTMRRYLDQIACVLRPGSVTGADLALTLLRCVPGRDRTGCDLHRAADPPPPRGPTSPGWRNVPGRTKPGSPPPPSHIGSAPCGCSWSASTNGAGTRHPPGCQCFPATCPGKTIRSPRAWTTPRPQSCSAPPRPTSVSWSGSPSRC